MIIGYARTSTTDQTHGLAAQQTTLSDYGCERVFSEQVSAKSTARPELANVLDYIRDGDVLVVTKPDRLARSTADLLDIVRGIEAKNASLVILSMGGQVLDTSNPTSKMMLTMLAAVAEFERDLMLERQREGIAQAKSAGKYQGRPPMADEQRDAILTMLDNGTSPTETARKLGISRATVYRIEAVHKRRCEGSGLQKH
ncbi:recombinase family protein [Acetobacter sp. DsW_063]|uniref:recombinase family protein n=1 Tax=Acetobacter sp. DsW_063 TaxID=1514894 RepID=UPI000A3A498B|nr:recombinase family protein [Acetobacter sp. DsW_063]